MSGNEIAQSGARTISWRHVVNKAIRPIGPDSQLPFFGSYHSQGRVVFASQISTLPLTVLKPLECYLCLTLQHPLPRANTVCVLPNSGYSLIIKVFVRFHTGAFFRLSPAYSAYIKRIRRLQSFQGCKRSFP